MRDNGIPTDALESGKRKVLIVDDDEELVELITDALERDGRFEIRSVNNGFDAGMMVKEYRPDLIVLDVMLPDINGKEVCQRVRSDKSMDDVRIICISGMVEEDKVSELRRPGPTTSCTSRSRSNASSSGCASTSTSKWPPARNRFVDGIIPFSRMGATGSSAAARCGQRSSALQLASRSGSGLHADHEESPSIADKLARLAELENDFQRPGDRKTRGDGRVRRRGWPRNQQPPDGHLRPRSCCYAKKPIPSGGTPWR